MTKSLKVNNVVYDVVIKTVTPTSDGVITTAERYPQNLALNKKSRAILDTERAGKIMEIQKIVAVSELAKTRGFEIGQDVLISFNRYALPYQKKNTLKSSLEGEEDYMAAVKYQIPVVEINGKECLKIVASDIEYIVEDYEIIQS